MASEIMRMRAFTDDAPPKMAAGFGASQLLASAFSSNLNCTVITRQERDQNKKDGYFAALDLNQLFNISQVTGAVGDVRPDLPVADLAGVRGVQMHPPFTSLTRI